MESVNSSLDVAITHASDSRDQKVAPETDRGPSPRPCVVASTHVSADVEMRSISDDVPTRARRHGPNHSLSGESTTSPTHMSDASLRSGRDLTSVERPAKQRRTGRMNLVWMLVHPLGMNSLCDLRQSRTASILARRSGGVYSLMACASGVLKNSPQNSSNSNWRRQMHRSSRERQSWNPKG